MRRIDSGSSGSSSSFPIYQTDQVNNDDDQSLLKLPHTANKSSSLVLIHRLNDLARVKTRLNIRGGLCQLKAERSNLGKYPTCISM